MTSPSQDRADLEARFAWLERHVAEQDKVIHELGEEIRRLKKEARAVQARLQNNGGPDATLDSDERPPHY